MYNLQFFSATQRQWVFYGLVAFTGSLDTFISVVFEPYARVSPRTSLRIIDLNTGNIVYS
jgi:hypothetical protein